MEARIKKLEATINKAHRQAWEAFEARYFASIEALNPIREVFIDTLRKAGHDPQATTQTLWPDVIPELDHDAWWRFLDKSLELMEQAEFDLTIWPSDLPTPPQVPEGLWDKLLELRWSSNEQEVIAAGLGLMALSVVKAMRP